MNSSIWHFSWILMFSLCLGCGESKKIKYIDSDDSSSDEGDESSYSLQHSNEDPGQSLEEEQLIPAYIGEWLLWQKYIDDQLNQTSNDKLSITKDHWELIKTYCSRAGNLTVNSDNMIMKIDETSCLNPPKKGDLLRYHFIIAENCSELVLKSTFAGQEIKEIYHRKNN